MELKLENTCPHFEYWRRDGGIKNHKRIVQKYKLICMSAKLTGTENFLEYYIRPRLL